MLIRYVASLKPATMVLWCYLLWYLVTVVNHFDPSWRLWLNALGISALVGTALVLSVGLASLRSGSRWIPFRLFLMPFCVSSFASLIKGKGFLLVLPPTRLELLQSLGACAAFLTIVFSIQALERHHRARRLARDAPIAGANASSTTAES